MLTHTLYCLLQMMDLMGYEKASPVNKINIHVGGVYGDKEGTLERFAVGFRKLSPRLQARLTVENDDLANSFSVADLMKLHEKIKMPIVFDFHHYKFCKGACPAVLSSTISIRAACTCMPVRCNIHG